MASKDSLRGLCNVIVAVRLITLQDVSVERHTKSWRNVLGRTPVQMTVQF